jgi:uncharacterized protein YodC (DUF2158 family)
MTTFKVVGTLFRGTNTVSTKVLCRYFNGHGQALSAFEVATDYDGYFEDKVRE